MRTLRVAALLACTLALAGTGCISKSSTSQASSESSSDSSRSSSKSSTSSSRSSGNAAYVGDVRDATEQWLLSGSDRESFQRDLARIAEDYGVTDWQSDQTTFEAIGRGLKRARLSGDRLEQMKLSLGEGNPQFMKWIQAGYKSERAA